MTQVVLPQSPHRILKESLADLRENPITDDAAGPATDLVNEVGWKRLLKPDTAKTKKMMRLLKAIQRIT